MSADVSLSPSFPADSWPRQLTARRLRRSVPRPVRAHVGASSGSSSGRRLASSSGWGTPKPGGSLPSNRPAPCNSSRPGRSPIASRPKWTEEFQARAIGDRPARRFAAPAHAHPARLHQHVERAFGDGDAADFLDVGARHRLVIGDDRQRLDRRARQFALVLRLRAPAARQDRARCETSSAPRRAPG